MAIWKRIRKYRDREVTKEDEEKLSKLEKGDMPAMILAAFLTLWLPCLLILLALVGVLVFLFT